MMKHRGNAKSRNVGLRLDRVEQSAAAEQARRAEIVSQERTRLIAAWHVPGAALYPGGVSEEEADQRLLIMAEEVLYRMELKSGPVKAVPPPEETSQEGTPEVFIRSLPDLTDGELAGYCKWILVAQPAGQSALLAFQERQ